MPEKKMESTNY